MKDFSHARLYTGLSSNNPRMFDFEVIRGDKEINVTTPVKCTWKDIDPSELSVPENVTIVDDVDPGFSFNDAGRTWLQKWFEKPLEPRGFSGPIPTRWTPSIDIFYYGDSIRSCYFKGFGKGDFIATWKTELKTAGRYRISARASKRYIDPRMEIPKGVIYHYTIKSDKEEIKKGVELDRFIHYRQWEGWICLGDFDFPAGEVSVTLSDYDELGRDFIAVIADAVKWEKLED